MAGKASTTLGPEGRASPIVLALSPRAIAAGAITVAVVAGALLARSPTLGLALVAAIFFVPLALTNLPLAIALWVPLIAVEQVRIAGSSPYLGTVVIVGAFLGDRLRHRGVSERASMTPGAWAWPLGGFLAWISLSSLWAKDAGVSLEVLREYVAAVAVLAVLALSLARPRHIALVALAFVAGAVLSVLAGLAGLAAASTTADAIDTATRSRISGGAGDPNALAAMLVPAVAIAVGLLSYYRHPVLRLGLIAATLVMSYGFVLTQSRGGFLAALVAAALSLAMARRLAVLASVVAVLAVAGAIFAMSPGALGRVTNYDGGGTGRADLWTVAWRMAADHPLQGVGVGNYVVRSREYVLQRPGALEYSELIIADKPLVAHNVYLQTLAEVGAVGLALLLAVLASSLGAGLAASRRFKRRHEPAMAALAQAVVVGTAGSLAASFFISNTTTKWLFALLALGPALLIASAEPSAIIGPQRAPLGTAHPVAGPTSRP
ncbi:MAG: O-antigen ligase family protein [Solirubrobacteraceae bacterium]